MYLVVSENPEDQHFGDWAFINWGARPPSLHDIVKEIKRRYGQCAVLPDQGGG